MLLEIVLTEHSQGRCSWCCRISGAGDSVRDCVGVWTRTCSSSFCSGLWGRSSRWRLRTASSRPPRSHCCYSRYARPVPPRARLQQCKHVILTSTIIPHLRMQVICAKSKGCKWVVQNITLNIHPIKMVILICRDSQVFVLLPLRCCQSVFRIQHWMIGWHELEGLGTEEIHEKPQSEYTLSWPRFETDISYI
jgi:hypothetical protein